MIGLLPLSKNKVRAPSGGIDNLLVRRAIIKVVGYRMIVGYIHTFTEPRRRHEKNKQCFGSLATEL